MYATGLSDPSSITWDRTAPTPQGYHTIPPALSWDQNVLVRLMIEAGFWLY